MNPIFFSIQGSYKQIEISLFKDLKRLCNIKREGSKASSKLISYFNDMLQENSLSLDDVKFIVLDQGPGAFTSLRVVISTVNGIGFASSISLIGINGLEALAYETATFVKKWNDPLPIIVPLLNAFNNDVYFSAYEISKNNLNLLLQAGCKNIDKLLGELREAFADKKYLFSGNGTELFKEKIKVAFESRSIIPDKFPLTCSAKQIGIMGLNRWDKKESLSQWLLPIYLKIQRFKPKYS